MKFGYTFLIILWFATISLAQTPKTFYVGHSLSDQIPDMVQSLSDDDPSVDFSWVYQSIPGAPLRWQWDRKDANDYTENPPQFYSFYNPSNGLPSGDFDILILTESVPRYPSIIGETYQYADSFFHYATSRNPNIRVYLYEDWHCILSGTPTGCDYDVDSNPWRQRLDDDLPMWESVVDTLNKRYAPDIPVCLIPGGQGLARLYDSIQVNAIPEILNIEDIFSDNIHLTDIGKYFIACIHFAMIHEKSPVGLTNQLQHWWGGDLGAPSEETALKLQEIAWETVISYPKSCLNVSTKIIAPENKSTISIFPNPTSGIVNIIGLSKNSIIRIYNAHGVLDHTYTGQVDQLELSLRESGPGLYFIQIFNQFGDLDAVEKVIVAQ